MGMSIENAVTKWEKKEKTFYMPRTYAKFSRNDMSVPEEIVFEDYANVMSTVGGLTVFEDEFSDKTFSLDMFEIYADKTKEFLKHIQGDEQSSLNQWLNKTISSLQLDTFMGTFIIYMTYEAIVVSDGLEEINRNVWVPVERYPLPEDGKLLSMAISNLNSLYGISLSSVMLSSDDLSNYEEDTRIGTYVDEIVERDTTYLAKLMRTALETMVADKNDEFFEERMPRLDMILKALENGAKFIYSV